MTVERSCGNYDSQLKHKRKALLMGRGAGRGRLPGDLTVTAGELFRLGRPVLATDGIGSLVVEGRLPIPTAFDHVRNLFEASRPGRPVVRPDDLVALRVETRNLTIEPGSPPRLKKTGTGSAHLILHFPPQSYAEETFFEQKPAALTDTTSPNPNHEEKPVPPGGNEDLREPPIRARIADESRLAFQVPDGFDIEYTLPAVLAACRGLTPSVSPAALPRGATGRIFRLEELIDVSVVGTLSARRRAGLAQSAVSALRIGAAQQDIATLRARQASGGLGISRQEIGRDLTTVRPVIPREPPRPTDPAAAVTAIEMPWRLILSPHADTRWRHADEPVTSVATQRTELWHSRLVAPQDDGEEIEPPCPDRARTTPGRAPLRHLPADRQPAYAHRER